MSGSQLNHQNFNKQLSFNINSRGLRKLSGLIGLALAIFLILAPSLACAVQITLAWDSNVEPDVAGYIVYYGTQSGHYAYDVDVGDYDSVTISGLNEDVKYYFAVTAYDDEGNESDFSAEIIYPRTSTYTASGTSGGSNEVGACFITAASEFSTASERNDNLKKFALILLVISLLLAALLPRCVPIPRTRQQ
ncbi:MAG: fibronectin type III domain-containing protein [Deltaproteobacteria bacterium]|nr:fibronectin type III domain-containing protein [Deltaproteobacteria bacterium]